LHRAHFLLLGKTEAEIPITRPVYSTKTFGVCIHSPLFGPVKAQTIIQNIEINKVLGAEWFTFYVYTSDQASLQVCCYIYYFNKYITFSTGGMCKKNKSNVRPLRQILRREKYKKRFWMREIYKESKSE
jgi:hypothetical protein